MPFRISVLGQSFQDQPEIFDKARTYFYENVDYWGYLKNREEYSRVLREADVVVSTAKHEFFGISIVEAIAAGAYPLVPDR